MNRPLAVLAVSGVLLVGCGSSGWFGESMESLGLADIPDPDAEVLDVVLDTTPGASGNRNTLGSVLEAVLAQAALRPRSTVRLWIMTGDSVGDLVLTGSIQSPPFSAQGGERARSARAGRWARENLDILISRSEPYLDRNDARQSPLFEVLTKVSLAPVPEGVVRQVVLVSDGRPVSDLAGDLECGRVPEPEQLIRRLHGGGVLLPGSLEAARITLSHY